MINTRVDENEKRVYIEVSGYINSKDASEFMNEYRQMTKRLRCSQYTMVVVPTVFECEDENDIRNACMAFFKTGYKRIYIVDPNGYIMDSMAMNNFERKMFSKAVKIVTTLSAVK